MLKHLLKTVFEQNVCHLWQLKAIRLHDNMAFPGCHRASQNHPKRHKTFPIQQLLPPLFLPSSSIQEKKVQHWPCTRSGLLLKLYTISLFHFLTSSSFYASLLHLNGFASKAAVSRLPLKPILI